MSKTRTILIVVVSVTVGLIAGAALASEYWTNFNSEFMMSGAVIKNQADIVTKVIVIEKLRSGRVEDAKESIENLLDGDLIFSLALVRTGRTLSENAMRSIAIECQARSVSGYESHTPTVRSSVHDACQLLGQKK